MTDMVTLSNAKKIGQSLGRMRAFHVIAMAIDIVPALFCLTLLVGQMPGQENEQVIGSRVCVYHLLTKLVDVVYRSREVIEAPNWAPDGKSLLVNSGGVLYKLPLGKSESVSLQKIDTGSITHCNNDKGYSPDGALIAFSGSMSKGSQVYTIPTQGGSPKLIVPETPSYFHAFSPDSQWMAFVAERNNNFDLFRVPTGGGIQQRLTMSPGYDDGPDYSPDGQWIYFNSNRSGSWKIWRMPGSGAGPDDQNAEQATNDDQEDWFPHCSPDGKWLVFLSFPKGTPNHNGHMQVKLRMMRLPGEQITREPIQEIKTFFGGQGTINVNSWSPDSLAFAFVNYEH